MIWLLPVVAVGAILWAASSDDSPSSPSPTPTPPPSPAPKTARPSRTSDQTMSFVDYRRRVVNNFAATHGLKLERGFELSDTSCAVPSALNSAIGAAIQSRYEERTQDLHARKTAITGARRALEA